MSGTAYVRIDSVGKTFGDVTALDGVTLDVPAGTTLALLGPSGCGKTTLLRVLAGLDVAEHGSVWIDDDLVAGPGRHVPPERRHVGMVFQEWALFPHLDVARNVGYGLSRAEIRAGRVTEALELVRLAQLAARRPHELSGGQAQRVAVARALAPRPRVMLFDEPFSSLDTDLRGQLRGEVADLMRAVGMTSVFVTHDQAEAFVIGDRVAVMHEGRIIQVGTPAEVYDMPATPWVASFVGQANLLAAHAVDGSARTDVGPVALRAPLDGDCRVLVRPEHLALEHGGDAEVTAVEFYGHDTTYRIRLGSSVLLARLMDTPQFRPGDTVRVRYAGPASMAYAASARTAVTASVAE